MNIEIIYAILIYMVGFIFTYNLLGIDLLNGFFFIAEKILISVVWIISLPIMITWLVAKIITNLINKIINKIL